MSVYVGIMQQWRRQDFGLGGRIEAMLCSNGVPTTKKVTLLFYSWCQLFLWPCCLYLECIAISHCSASKCCNFQRTIRHL